MKKIGIQVIICAVLFGAFMITGNIEEGNISEYSDKVKAYITKDNSLEDIKEEAISAMSMAVEKPQEMYEAVSGRINTDEFTPPVDEASVSVFNENSKGEDMKYMSDDTIIVYASGSGMAESVKYDNDKGKYTVIIKHDDGISTKYEGCTKVYITEKGRIAQGQLIGEVDNEGIRDLVFEMWKDGEKIAPGEYIK
ncbi:MAG: M23 family metallopeptidase [Firmicutes bacterium]|nr:M23 family metallopeptidase [Clostridiales bacterium]MBQ4340574.1 M23 family metallopeptidase [Bacillota bacterium]